MTLMRLEPAAPRSRVKPSTTEPLRSLTYSRKMLVTPGVSLTLYLIETPFDKFANRSDSSYKSKSCLIRVYSVCLWKYDIADPTLVDFFVPCTNMKVYSYSQTYVKHRLNSFLENEGSFPVINIFLVYLLK